jgi:hypothetical protein
MSSILSGSGITRYFLQALGKFATARLRQVGAMSVYPDWQARAEVCERCALRVVSCGNSYCGSPLLKQIERDPAVDGCGCPCHDKAKSAGEHCPINERYQPAEKHDGACNCKWCTVVSDAASVEQGLQARGFDGDLQPVGKAEAGRSGSIQQL